MQKRWNESERGTWGKKKFQMYVDGMPRRNPLIYSFVVVQTVSGLFFTAAVDVENDFHPFRIESFASKNNLISFMCVCVEFCMVITIYVFPAMERGK